MLLERNIRNMPTMKNRTPIAHCQPRLTAGHTIQIEDNAKTTPIRCVQVLPISSNNFFFIMLIY
jgi:hypothetical protein